MMKLILLGLIGVSVGADAQTKPRPRVAPAAEQRPSLPIFSFMGDDTDTPTKRTSLNATPCTTSANLTECTDYSSPKIGGADLKWLSMSFNNGMLYEVIAGTWTNRYSTLLDAFTEKYGKPRMEVRKWQAKSGASFDNAVANWDFKEGVLELKSLGPDLNTSSFAFVSTANAPPREKPKIDF